MRVFEKSTAMLVDELCTTLLRCWFAQEKIMDTNLTEKERDILTFLKYGIPRSKSCEILDISMLSLKDALFRARQKYKKIAK